jgi:DNA-binding HxlR family transcriptional regulator
MKQLIVRRLVNTFGTLSIAQLCNKNRGYSPAMVQRVAEKFVADGCITRTEAPHHKTGLIVVKYHSLTPATRNTKDRAKKPKPEPLPQHTINANRLKRIISARPGITEGLLMNAAKWSTHDDVAALYVDDEVIRIVQTHPKTRREYSKLYMNYNRPFTP